MTTGNRPSVRKYGFIIAIGMREICDEFRADGPEDQ
jgi:hypothetical protein